MNSGTTIYSMRQFFNTNILTINSFFYFKLDKLYFATYKAPEHF